MGPIVVGLSSQRKRNEGRALAAKARLPVPGCPCRWDQERMGGLWCDLADRQCIWCCRATVSLAAVAVPCLWADAMT